MTCDLVDLSHLSKYNKKYKFLLVCIDAFSRYMQAIPLKSKKGDEVVKALQEIIEGSGKFKGLRKLWTDRGTEFYNRAVKRYLQERGMTLYSVYSPLKASMVERAQRTLKSLLYKYMTEYNTFAYLPVLPDIVKGYNIAPHRGLKRDQSPASVHEMTDPQDIMRQFRLMNSYDKKRSHSQKKSLPLGATVRLVGSSRTAAFAKGYLAHNTLEIFKIRKIDTSQPVTTYFVEDLNGKDIEGSFYANELVPVKAPETYPIDIIRRRGNQYRVRFRGYDSSFDQWVNKKDLVRI